MTDIRNNGRTVALAAGAAVLGAAWWAARQRRTMDFRDRVVLITGGSRGLGLHMAREFAAQGANLALVARNAEELAAAQEELELQGAEVMVRVADLTDRSETDRAIEDVIDCFGRIDVLVNNAGVIQVGPIEHMKVSDFEASLRIHVLAPLYTTLALLPYFRLQGGGRIVNISSIGGKIAVPHLLPYCVGKFGLVGLSDGMRVELRKHNVYVTTVCPGLMRTGSPTQALFKGQYQREYAWFVTGDVMPGASIAADVAARRIVRACQHGQARLVVSLPAKLAVLANEIAPELTTRISDAVNRLLPGPLPKPDYSNVRGWDSRGLEPAWAERRRAKAGAEANEFDRAFA